MFVLVTPLQNCAVLVLRDASRRVLAHVGDLSYNQAGGQIMTVLHQLDSRPTLPGYNQKRYLQADRRLAG